MYTGYKCSKSQKVGCRWIYSGTPMHYGLSNVIIRDQSFAKVCKSKTLFLAHFLAERAKFFFYRSKTAKSLQQVFFKYFFQQKNAKSLAFDDKKPEGLVP